MFYFNYIPTLSKLRIPHNLSNSKDEIINWYWAFTRFDSALVKSFWASRISSVVLVPTLASLVTPSTAIKFDSTETPKDSILDFELSIFFHEDLIWNVRSSFLVSIDLII